MKTLLKNSKEWNSRPTFITTENKGAGSAFDPPGYHSHYFGIVAGYDRDKGFQEYASVDYYLESEYVPDYVKLQIKNIIKKHTPVTPINKEWIKRVLKHWKTFDRDINKHCGVIFIRRFYSNYIPSNEDIKMILN